VEMLAWKSHIVEIMPMTALRTTASALLIWIQVVCMEATQMSRVLIAITSFVCHTSYFQVYLFALMHGADRCGAAFQLNLAL